MLFHDSLQERIDGIFLKILLKKGNVKLFLYLKEKVTKRSHTDASVSVQPLPVDRLSSVAIAYREARQALRESLRFGEELFACQNLWWVLYAVGYSESQVRMEALPSAWCIVGTIEIPSVLFSPQ